MSALNEKPNAEPLPGTSGAAILQDGHYLPPPADADGKRWVRTTVQVQRSPEELYAMWQDVENVPAWQEEISEVVKTGDKTTRWTMKAGDKTLSWTGEVMTAEPGKRIVWRTIEGDLDEAGEVIFEAAPGGRGTFVILLQMMRVGKLANAWESLTNRNPKQRAIENLRHFKALAETGEIPNSQTAPHGERGLVGGAKRSLYGENILTHTGTTTA